MLLLGCTQRVRNASTDTLILYPEATADSGLELGVVLMIIAHAVRLCRVENIDACEAFTSLKRLSYPRAASVYLPRQKSAFDGAVRSCLARKNWGADVIPWQSSACRLYIPLPSDSRTRSAGYLQ